MLFADVYEHACRETPCISGRTGLSGPASGAPCSVAGRGTALGRLLRPASARKTRKIRKRGRHAAPSQFHKVAVRAAKIGPAVAVVGALAATPQIRGLAGISANASTGHIASGQTHPSQLSDLAAGQDTSARQHASRRRRGTRAHTAVRAAHPATGQAKLSRHSSRPAKPAPHAASHPAVACAGTASGGMLPANYAAIVNFLTVHGYTRLAAAGIAGNIYRESMGNPESVGTGGGG